MYNCEHCAKSFTKPAKLEIHRRSHTGERPFKCTWEGCDHAFARECHLTRHVSLVHKKERLYKCPTCGKDFSTNSNMERHKKKHDDPNPFACTEPGCSERFAKRNQLDRHISLHTGNLPYPCTHEGCDKFFQYPAERKKHIAKVHLGLKNYLCGIPGCGISFESHALLIRHQKEAHAEEYKCDQCEKVFSTEARLNQHKKSHDITQQKLFACTECGKSFVKKSNLKTHVKSAHEGVTYDCSECGSKFKHKHTLVQHMRKHERQNNTESNDENSNNNMITDNNSNNNSNNDNKSNNNQEVQEKEPSFEPPKKKARKEKNPVDLLVGPTPPRVTVTEG